MFDYLSFIEAQLAEWPLARENYSRLGETQRRRVEIDDLSVGVQLNPARIVSTAAKVSGDGVVAPRPCFLCSANRPESQFAASLVDGWDLLVNPFPVFPVHLTVVAREHSPQLAIPIEMASFAEMMPPLTFFFNGARAGASAPDHLHFQGVLTEELPLMALVSRMHPASRPGVESSCSWGLSLPFSFYSAVVEPGTEGMRILRAISHAAGIDRITGLPDPKLVNAYVFLDVSGLLRVVVVPRSAHRPDCYYASGPDQRLVSPGAVEMAGVIITPRPEDYEHLSEKDIRTIYSQTAIQGPI